MSYFAYITTLRNVRDHSNAHSLKLADCFDCQVVIGKDYQEGEVVCYFPEGGRLSEEFCNANKLLRKDNGYFEDSRRVRAQKFRGEVSDGFACRLDLLERVAGKEAVAALKVGDRFDTLNGIKVCEKYITEQTRQSVTKSKKVSRGATKYFPRHIDTENISYYLHKIKPGDVLVVTSKIHGSSVRGAYVLDDVQLPRWKQLINKVYPVFPTQEYRHLNGTRNVILSDEKTVVNDRIRREIATHLEGKLNKGELVFLEVAGFDGVSPIMPPHNTKKLGDKEFTKKYGESMIYSYDCKQNQYRLFLYRNAYVTEDGAVIDLPWNDVKRRALELGIEHPVELDRFIYDGDQDALIKRLTTLADQADPIGDHWSEGICIRKDDRSKIEIYKMKNVRFKIMESIEKDTGVLNPEEAA